MHATASAAGFRSRAQLCEILVRTLGTCPNHIRSCPSLPICLTLLALHLLPPYIYENFSLTSHFDYLSSFTHDYKTSNTSNTHNTPSHKSHTMISFIFLLTCFVLVMAAPLPAIITRVHTAAAVTEVKTYTTGTTTVWLPPVEVLISDDVTYTFTVSTGQWATAPNTYTSYFTDVNKAAAPATPAASAPAAETTTPTTAAPLTAQPSFFSTSTLYSTEDDYQAETTATPATAQTTPSQTPQTTQSPTTTQGQSSLAAQVQIQSTLVSSGVNAFALVAQTVSSQQTQNVQATTQATTSTSATSSTAASSSASSASSGSLHPPSTIVYSPYADDTSCKTYATIQLDLELIYSKGIRKLRTYSTDCAHLTAVLPIAAKLGMTVNQGFWISSAGVDSIDDSVSDLISWASQNGWSVFDFFTVGNEAVIAGYCSASELISKIASVKSQLQAAGWSGSVTTAEPPATFIAHPELCTKSEIDIVGINSHSYFNTNLYANQAGEYVASQKAQIEELCSKNALVVETGYPSQGDTNGNNVPSAANQAAAVLSILNYLGNDVTILTTYNDMWKQPGPYGIEQYFGTIDLF